MADMCEFLYENLREISQISVALPASPRLLAIAQPLSQQRLSAPARFNPPDNIDQQLRTVAR
jgi:hypothetical protein